MKYDEKTGEKIPENRSDEINISMERLVDIRKKTGGFNNKEIEICDMLCDINVSLGLVVDILSVMYNRLIGKDGTEKNDERSAETEGSVE